MLHQFAEYNVHCIHASIGQTISPIFSLSVLMLVLNSDWPAIKLQATALPILAQATAPFLSFTSNLD